LKKIGENASASLIVLQGYFRGVAGALKWASGLPQWCAAGVPDVCRAAAVVLGMLQKKVLYRDTKVTEKGAAEKGAIQG
jgi:hypothetical protein